MKDLAERLKDQNTGTTWIDCEQRGLKHRLTPEPVPGYSRCTRCPVVIRHGQEPKGTWTMTWCDVHGNEHLGIDCPDLYAH